MKRIFSGILVMLTLVLAGLTGPAQAQDNRGQVILVLDASGSMWGQIDGKSKIEIAREVIADMLGDWSDTTDLGLLTYGHRNKGDCGDIEMVVAPQPLNSSAFLGAVNAISPKGKTPIGDSVRMAAEALRYTEDRATVILVSDGLETCNADPCALAAQLEGQGVDFTAHVIGFDLSDTDQAQLACIADNTGGQFFAARNAAGLTDALTETVAVIKTAEATPAPALAPAPAPEPEPAGPQAIRVTGKLCDSCDLLPEEPEFFWWVYEAEQDINGNRKEVARSGSPVPIFELAAGDYHVVGRYGSAFARADLSVAPGALTDHVMNFDAGHLRADAWATPNGTVLTDDMFWWVYEAKTDLQGNRKEIARSGSALSFFRLPAGDYHVVARHGTAFANATLTVEAGGLNEVRFDMNVGYARFSGIPTEGAPALDDDMFWWVYEAKKDLNGNRKEITRSGSPVPLFKLNAGEYHVVARHGNAFASADLTVAADSLLERVFDLNVGYLRVKALMAEGLPALEDDMFYWVYEAKTDLQGNRKEITRSGSAQPLFKLPAGDYHLVARHGRAFASADLTVAAGGLQDIEMVQNSARVKLVPRLTAGGEALTSGVFWWVFAAEADLQGNRAEIARDGAAQPVLTLPAGAYLLRMRLGESTYDVPLSLSPGEERIQDIVVEQ